MCEIDEVEMCTKEEWQDREKIDGKAIAKRGKSYNFDAASSSSPSSPILDPSSKLSHDSRQQDHTAVIDRLVECRRSVGGKDAQSLGSSVR